MEVIKKRGLRCVGAGLTEGRGRARRDLGGLTGRQGLSRSLFSKAAWGGANRESGAYPLLGAWNLEAEAGSEAAPAARSRTGCGC